MDTQTLTESLQGFEPGDYNWKFALYTTRKTRDGAELDWSLCNMRGISEQLTATRDWLLKKPIAEKPVAAYTPLVSDKENIGVLEKGDEIIREQITDVLLSLQNGKVGAFDAIAKPIGYAFFGERTGAEGAVDQVLFMRRGNPFLSGTTARLCVGVGDEILPADTPILKFGAVADFLLIGNSCYIISSAIGKDFGLENRYFAIAQQCLDKISAADIISDYELFDQAVMTAKNARKFVDFDEEVLAHIAKLPITEREDFLSTYGVYIDRSGRMDTADKEQCELIIDLLCGRSCLDPLGRLSVVSNIAPSE